MRKECANDQNDGFGAARALSEEEDSTKAVVHLANNIRKTKEDDDHENENESASSWSVDGECSDDDDQADASVNKSLETEVQAREKSHSNELMNQNRFPNKLMRILDSKEYEHIFAWNKTGDSIVIHKPYDLISDVLTKHFGAKEDMRFDSFLRKLYRWGFSKRLIDGDNEEGEHIYCHNCFRRGDYASCSKVKCMSKPTSRRITSAIDDRPMHPNNPTNGNIKDIHELYAIRQQHQLAAGVMSHTTLSPQVQTSLEQHRANLLLQQLSVAASVGVGSGVAARSAGTTSDLLHHSHHPLNRSTISQLSSTTNELFNTSRAIESALVSREIERIQRENNFLSQLAATLHLQQEAKAQRAQAQAQQTMNIASMNRLVGQQALPTAGATGRLNNIHTTSGTSKMGTGKSMTMSMNTRVDASSSKADQVALNEVYHQELLKRTAIANKPMNEVAHTNTNLNTNSNRLNTPNCAVSNLQGHMRERDAVNDYLQRMNNDPQTSPSQQQKRRFS